MAHNMEMAIDRISKPFSDWFICSVNFVAIDSAGAIHACPRISWNKGGELLRAASFECVWAVTSEIAIKTRTSNLKLSFAASRLIVNTKNQLVNQTTNAGCGQHPALPCASPGRSGMKNLRVLT